jgi:hypothetical protein
MVTAVKVRRLYWTGHVVRMEGQDSVSGRPRRKKETRKTKVKMDDCVEDDVRTLGVGRWVKKAEDGEE